MTDVKAALTELGWRVNTDARYAQAVGDFQGIWNIGAALKVDGNPGPVTRRALNEAMERREHGMKDVSEHFNAAEFACNCDGKWADCKRIWTPRSTVQLAERYRAIVGPLTIVRGCRCPNENKRVRGTSRSQHLYGRGLDVGLFNITVGQLQARKLPGLTGIGYYTGPDGRQYVRHLDNRPGTPVIPWSYGRTSTKPMVLRPGAPSTPSPQKPPAPPAIPEEGPMTLTPADLAQIRAIVQEEATAKAIFTRHSILKDTRAVDPETAPRVTPSTLLEAAAAKAIIKANTTPKEPT